MQRRLALVAGMVVVWTGLIQGRLVHLQVVQHAELTAYANGQHTKTDEIPAKRGDIIDRNGRVLAYTVVGDRSSRAAAMERAA
jgi:cell division protein FtsI (penicillin-binding protein 3)